MKNYNEIISFDKNKVCEFEENGIKTIFKKTNYTEVENLLRAKKFLKNKVLKLNGIKYNIQVPDILEWNEKAQTLHMTFCSGQNMELILRDEDQRKQYIELFQVIFMFMFKEGFYWEDFAPRNILLQDNIISLVDFEKGLNFCNMNLRKFLREHVYEEYSSFLLPEERLIDSTSVFLATKNERREQLPLDSIKVKRIKTIAKMLGYPPIITRQQYLQIQSLIIRAETPYLSHGHIIFPRIKLEDILQDKLTNPMAYHNYAREILQSAKFKDDNSELII